MKLFGKITRTLLASLMIMNLTMAFAPKSELPFEAEQQTTENINESNEKMQPKAVEQSESEEETAQEENEQSDIGNQINVPTTFAEPADWAFTAASRPLEQALISQYPTIDRNRDGYITRAEANQYPGNISLLDRGITGTIDGIEYFVSVGEINLSGNNLTGNIPENIGALSAYLTLLHLNGNKLSGSIPTSIDRLTKLTRLNLGNNNLSGKIPDSLTTLRSTTFRLLALDNNNFTDLSRATFDFINRVSDTGTRQGFLNNQTNTLSLPQAGRIYDNYTFAAYPAYSQFPSYNAQSQFVYELTLPNGTRRTITPALAANGSTLTVRGTDLTQPGRYQLNARITAANAVFTGTVYTTNFDVAAVNQTVNFETDTDTPIAPQQVLKGSYITDPRENTVLEKEGYIFDGWYSDAARTTRWNFATNPVMENLTLYAKWNPAPYNVIFDFNNGVDASIQNTVLFGANITPPDKEPTKIGHTFIGWYTAQVGGEKWDFTEQTMPARDLNLYAQYTPNTYTITFNYNNGTDDKTEGILKFGDIITAPESPIKAGHTFIGWYTALEGGEKWDFTNQTMPAGNVTLYAHYLETVYNIEAHDFVISLAELEQIVSNKETETKFINYARAKAYDITLPDNIKELGITLSSEVQVATGVQAVTFTTGGGVTKTVNVYVYNTVDREAGEAMSAEDFAIALSDVSVENFIAYAKAKGYDISALPGTEVAVNVTSALPTTPGTYDVTFATASGQTTMTVKVYVYNTVNREAEEAINAEDFAIALNDISEANFITYAKAKGYNMTTLPGTEVPVSVLSALPTTTGTYDVTFATVSGKTITTVKAYVYNTVNRETGEAINAHDFTIPLRLANEANFRLYSEVQAYRLLATPEGVTMDTTPKAVVGAQAVTFSTASGTSITVTANVVATNVSIEASDIVMSLAEARATSGADLLARTGAKVNTTNAGATTSVGISTEDVEKLTGLTVTPNEAISIQVIGTDDQGDGTEKTINVYVYNTVNRETNEALSAEDFAIALDDVNAENVIAYAKAKGYDVSTLPGSEVPVSVLSVLPTTTGTYAVTFATASGKTTMSVKAYVYNTVNRETGEAINAHDFTIPLRLVSEANFRLYSEVQAYRLLATPEVVTMETTPEAVVGTQAVTFSTASGTSITVTANIVATNVSIEASDIVMSLAEARATSGADLLARVGAKVSTTNTGATTSVGINAEDIAKLTGLTVTPNEAISIQVIGTDDQGDGTEKAINVYVYNTVNRETNEAISAEDFAIALGDVSAENFIAYAKAKGYDISTLPGSEVPVTVTSVLPTTTGTYDVTFATASGQTTMSVKAYVSNALNREAEEAINAEDFAIALSDISEANFITYAKAKGYNVSTLPASEVAVSVTSALPTTPGTYDVTFATASGQTTMTVKAYVSNALNREAQEALNAEDFAIALGDVSAENFIAYAKAKGYDMSTLPGIEVPVSVTSALPTTPGTYDVTFATASGNTTMSVKAYVSNALNKEAQEALNAEDFAIALSDISEANFITYAKAKGYDVSTLPGTEVPVSVTSVLPTTPGTYDVTFATASGKTLTTVKAYVYNTVNREAGEAINAHDFTISLRFVNETNFRLYSEVQAYRLLATPEAVTMETTPEAVVGTQAVTFSTASGTSITVTANVVATNVAIEASDIVMSLAEARATSGADLLTRANVSVSTTNEGATTSVGISTEDVAKLTGLTVTPNEPISIQVIGTDDQGDGTEKAINVYVYNTVNRETNEALSAEDFAIALGDVSAENFIAYAKAKGYDVSTLPGSEVSVSVTSVLPTTPGTYDVTFATASGNTTMTVKAYVYNTVNRETNEALSAEDFAIALGDVSEANFIAYAKAKGYDVSTLPGSEVPVTVTSALPTTTGTYDVTFATASGNTTMTVKAYVYNTVNRETNEALSAEDFAIALDDVNAGNFIAYAKAKGYNVSTLPGSEIAVSVTSALPTTTGTYDVTFATASGQTTMTVKAYVYNTVNKETNEALSAENFAIALEDVSEANFITYAKAKGYNVSTLPGTEVPVNVTSVLPTATGTYDVTFATASGNTTMTVKAYVYNTVNRETNEALSAEDFAIALGDVSAENFIAYAKAKGYNVSTLPGAEVSVSVTSALPTMLGTYDVTFATASGNTTMTVKAYVYNTVNRETNEALSAEDFAIGLDDVSDENFITYAKAKGYNVSTLPGSEVPVSVTSALPTTIGTYDVTFATASGQTTMTVKAYVYNTVNRETNEAINAHDFTIPLRFVNETNFRLYSEVQAYRLLATPEAVTMETTPEAVVGTQAVTFRTASGTSITVNANVVATNVAIEASDIVMSLAEARATSGADLLTRANVSVSTTNEGATTSVGISTEDVEKLTGLIATPSEPISIQVIGTDDRGDGAEKAINVYIYNTVNRETSEALSAENFAIALSDISEANIITYAKAKGYNVSTLPGSEVSVSVISALPTATGTYDVTFATASGNTTMTVKAYVSNALNREAQEALNSEDFAIALGDISAENFIAYAKAKGYDVSTLPGTEVPVTVMSVLPTAIGTYDVTFATASGKTMLTVKAYVYNTVNRETGEAINAHDFTLPLRLVSEANFRLYSGVQAYRLLATPEAVRMETTPEAVVGAQAVTFSTANGTSITVTANVVATNVSIEASDIVMSLVEAQATSGADLLARTGAKVNTTNEGATTSAGISTEDVAKLTGLTVIPNEPISIQVIGTDDRGDGAKKAINVYVYNTVNRETNEALSAEDFAIALDDVNAENVIAYAKAKGYVVSTLPGSEVPVSVTSALPTTIGTHDVTFATASGQTTMTVKAYVYNTVNRETNEALSAEDFAIALVDVSEANFIAYAKAKGYNVSTLPGSEVSVTVTSALPTAIGTYDVTFATASGQTRMTVKVYVYNTVNRETNEALSAEDFAIALGDVSEANFITYAKAKGYDVSTLPGSEVPVTVTSVLPTTIGTYDVTFATASGNTTMTVKAYVSNALNREAQEALNAEDFAIALSDVSAENFIVYAKTKGYDMTTLPGSEVPVTVTSVLPTMPGTYDVTFATASGQTRMTVKVYVYNTVNRETNEALSAEDFAIALGDVSAENFTAYAKAKGYDVSTLPGSEIPVSVTSVLPTTPGTYDVTFAIASGQTTMTVKAYVYNTVNRETNEALSAEDFAISLDDVNAENFIVYAKAKGYDVSTLPGSEIPVSVTSVLPTAIGTYDVTFATASGNTTMTVKAYVYNTVNRETNEALSAEDFVIALDDVNEANFITYAKAKGYNVSTLPGSEVLVTVTSVLPTTPGTYDVTFATASGQTRMTVKAYVYNTVNRETNEALSAEDFAIALGDVSAENFITYAKAKGYDVSTLPGSELSVSVTSALPTTTGTYDVTFATVSGQTTMSVKAYVYNTVNREINEALSAEDFAIALGDVSEANFITYAKAKGYDVSTLPGSEVSVTVTSVLPTTIGTYDVTFATASGQTTMTVKAYVYNTVNRETGEAINAHDFTIPLRLVSEANFRLYSEVQAYRLLATPEAVRMETTPEAVVGAQAVTFSTASGTSITVTANVVATNVSIEASDIVLSLTEAQVTSGADLLARANVSVSTTNKGATTSVGISAEDVAKLTGLTVIPNEPISIQVIGTDDRGDGAEKAINVYVYNTVNRETNEVLNAEDFAIALGDVSAENFIAYAKAKGYDVSTLPGSEVPVSVTSTLPTTTGMYDVTFATASGNTTMTVKAYVYNTVNRETNEALSAEDFAIALGDVSAENFIAYAKAKGYDVSTLPGSEVLVSVTSALPTTIGTYDVTFATASGNTTVTVKAYVYNTVNKETNEALSAEDFAIALGDVSAENFIAYAKAKGYDVSTLPGSEVPVSVTSALPTTIGTYDVTFATASGQTTMTVKAYVSNALNREAQEALNAEDFAIALGDVSAENFIAYAKAKGYDMSILPGSEVPVSVTSTLPTTTGTYDVTFATASGNTTMTVKAYVSNALNREAQEALNAEDFAIALGDVSAENFIAYANAKGYDMTTLPGSEVPVSVTSALPTTPGTYDVTFATASGNTTMTVKAYVSNALNREAQEALNAEDFAIALDDVSEANFVTYAKAKGYDVSILPGSEVPVSVISTLPTTAGTYDVTFATASGNTTMTVKAYVSNALNREAQEALNAEDFAIALDDVSEANFITYAKAKGYDVSTLPGSEVPVSVTSVLPTMTGTYDVTFATASGNTTVTVKAYVYNTVNRETSEAINAHDFVIPLSMVNETNFISYSEVQAYNISSLTRISVPVKLQSVLPDAIGEYDVTFTTQKGTMITVKATVIPSNITITAQDIAISLADAQTISELDLLDRVKANAITSNNNAVASVGISKMEIDKLTQLSAVPMEPVAIDITAADTVGDINKKSVNIYVYNVVNLENQEAMNAGDFSITLSEVNEANFINYAGLKGYDISSLPGTALDVVLLSDLPTATGVYDVTFAIKDRIESEVFALVNSQTTITVKVTVIDDANDVNTIVITADDIRLSATEFNELQKNKQLEQTILKKSNAQASIIETGEQLTPLHVDVTNILGVNVVGGETFNIDIYYETPTSLTQTIDDETTPVKYVKTIKVMIEKRLSLPTTGLYSFEMIVIGLLLSIFSIIILIANKKRRA